MEGRTDYRTQRVDTDAWKDAALKEWAAEGWELVAIHPLPDDAWMLVAKRECRATVPPQRT